MKCYFIVCCLLIGLSDAMSQKVRLENREDGKVIFLGQRKIKSIITMDGVFLEGKTRYKNYQLHIQDTTLLLTDIGIIESKKGSLRKIVGFPVKTIGVVTGVTGLLMSSAYASNDEELDPAVGIAGLTLVGVGVGTTLLSKKMKPSNAETTKSYHVKDWKFEWSG